MRVLTEAESPVIEGEEVDAESVQGLQLADAVGERAFAVVEEEQRGVGVAAGRIGRNPTAVKLKLTGLRGVEAYFVKAQADSRRRGSDGPRGMEDDLPLPLVEE